MAKNPKKIRPATKTQLKFGLEFADNTPESRKTHLTKKIIRDENARENITQYGVSLRVDHASRKVGKFYKKTATNKKKK